MLDLSLLAPLPSLFWRDDTIPREGWICVSARRFPTGIEPACPCCGKGFRDVLYRVFHPEYPEHVGELCEECANSLCDLFRPLPEPEESWVWLDLVALRSIESQPVKEEEVLPDEAAFMEIEGHPEESVVPGGVPLPGDPVALGGSSEFEGTDLLQLEGKGWRVSMKGNLFSHQKNFHVVIFPASKELGFKVMIDGKVGKCVYPDAVVATGNVKEAVAEMLCRGVIPEKLRQESGGLPVAVQREMSLR